MLTFSWEVSSSSLESRKQWDRYQLVQLDNINRWIKMGGCCCCFSSKRVELNSSPRFYHVSAIFCTHQHFYTSLPINRFIQYEHTISMNLCSIESRWTRITLLYSIFQVPFKLATLSHLKLSIKYLLYCNNSLLTIMLIQLLQFLSSNLLKSSLSWFFFSLKQELGFISKS